MKIILVRHGRTEWNKKELFRGRADMPLDQTGIRQSKKVAQHLSLLDLHIETIYSSPLQRTLQTAQAIAGKLGIQPVKVVEDFIEFDYGQWEGCSLEDIKKRFPQDYKYWMHDPGMLRIPGGEAFQQVKERVMRGLDFVVGQAKDKSIVIVAHKVINKAIIGLLLGWEETDFWEIEQDLACINIFEVHSGKAVTEILNDIGHLLRKGN